MIKANLWSFLVLVFLLSANAKLAQARQSDGDARQIQSILKELNLSNEQQAQIKVIQDKQKSARQTQKASRRDLRQSLKAQRQVLKELLAGTTASQAELQTQFEKVESLRQQMRAYGQANRASRFQDLLKMREVLGDQWPEFHSKMEKRKEKRRGARGSKRGSSSDSEED